MVKNVIKISLFFLLNLIVFSSLGQSDSIKAFDEGTVTSYFYTNDFLNYNTYIKLNSSQSTIQNYLPRNTIGNVGLPINSLHYKQPFGALGFNYAQNVYQEYFFTHTNLKFYKTRSPYTDLLYVMGSKKEQVFKGIFSYNIKPNWNVSTYFNRIRAEGFYLRQNVNQSYIAVSSNYISKNNRYGLLISGTYNDAKSAENGGIKYDSVFTEGGLIDKKIIEINLVQAKRELINRSISLKQILNIGKQDVDTLKTIIPSWNLVLESSYEDNDWRYNDENPSSGFYSNIYIDSIVTNDKIINTKIENTFSINRMDNLKHRGFVDWLGVSFNVSHQLLNVKQNNLDSTFNNIIVGGNFFNTYKTKKNSFDLLGRYVVSGFNKDDYSATGNVKMEVLKNLDVFFNAGIENRTSDFIYSYYNSNHFEWKNSFRKINKTFIGFKTISNKYHLVIGANYTNYSGITYFDNYSIARQYNGNINIVDVYLKKDFKFYNWHLDNTMYYNYVPDSTVIRLPQFVLNHSLYYENNVLKEAMRLQIGFSVFYTTSYYANAYMPATGQFYLQDSKKYGNYPFIDFFINAKIKMVSVFLKIEHLNSGLMGNTYIQTPNYPTNDRAFKIGIYWKFFD